MGRLAVRQILRVPKYIGEMVVIRSQDQLTPEDSRSVSKFGSPFELNLSGWSRFIPKPTLRELVEGPLPPIPLDAADAKASRFGRVGSPHRIDLKRARRRAKYFRHITTITGGLFSNWKQLSKTMVVYRDFLHNRMEYELDRKPTIPIEITRANNAIQRRAFEAFRAESKEGDASSRGSQTAPGRTEALRLMRLYKRLHGLIDETKVISKKRFTDMDRILQKFPLV